MRVSVRISDALRDRYKQSTIGLNVEPLREGMELMGFWEFVGKAIDTVDVLSGNARKRDLQKRINAEQYAAHSVTCNKCGALAGPISGTRRNYRCSCGRQFAGPNHPY